METGIRTDIPDNPNIRIIFRGFVITDIVPGASSASVGALAPHISICHQPRIHLYQLDGQGAATEILPHKQSDLRDNFKLSVQKASGKMIQVFEREPFDPKNTQTSHHKDFRWFINLRTLHKNKSQLNKGQLKPILTLEDGLFHVSDLSDEETDICRYDKQPPSRERFGKFAVEVTARISLGTQDSAQFVTKQGQAIYPLIMTGNDGNTYVMEFDCRCLTNEGTSDFPLVYKALTGLQRADKVSLTPPSVSSCPTDPDTEIDLTRGHDRSTSPEVYCYGGNHGG